jgi:hypothetical protein
VRICRAKLVVTQLLAAHWSAAGAAGDGKNMIKTLQSAGVLFLGTAKESKDNERH